MTAKRFTKAPQLAHAGGTYLWFELPNITNKDVKRVLGSGLSGQDKVKYSTRLYFIDTQTNRLYSLYKCYGVWRCGTLYDDQDDEVKQAIEDWLTA